jgi:hypothetical protein
MFFIDILLAVLAKVAVNVLTALVLRMLDKVKR